MLSRLWATLGMGLALAFPLSEAQSQDFAAEVEVDQSAPRISTLVFTQKPMPIQPQDGDPTKPTVTLLGRFNRKDWGLLLRPEKGKTLKVPTDAKGIFRLKIALTAPETEVRFVAVDPFGKAETQTIRLVATSYPFPKSGDTAKAPPKGAGKRIFFSPNIGYTYISYTQSGTPGLTEHAITVKAGVTYLLFPPHWDIGLLGYFTALPLAATPSELSARFLGINARIGYRFPFVRDPWRLSLQTGYFYTTMFTSGGNFGYQNQGAPQLYPALRRTLKNGDAIGLYAKFAPIMNGIQILDLSSREYAGGMNWTRPLKNGNNISVTLDIANLKLSLPGVTVTSTSYSLGFGYGF